MERNYFSIRMRAEQEAAHLCGAEQLCQAGSLPLMADQLVRRAMEHSRGCPDSISLRIEALPESPQGGCLPTWNTESCSDWQTGREFAAATLAGQGISVEAISAAMQALASGAAGEGQVMRGAMLVDAASGQRREPDRQRGIRVSRMGLADATQVELRRRLRAQNLDRLQVREALALAAKVLAAPGVLGELCWSDDPDYAVGYISTPQLGYLRIDPLKAEGDNRGGRAFFLAPGWRDLEQTIHFLERQPLLFNQLPEG